MTDNELFGLAIIVVCLAIGVAIVIASRRRVNQNQLARTPKRVRTPRPSPKPDDSGLEGLLGLLVVGAAGFALYRFLRSEAFSRLIDELWQLRVTVNGRPTTIGDALRSRSDLEAIVVSLIEQQLDGGRHNSRDDALLDRPGSYSETNLGQVLRDALEARMRREGLYS